MDANWLIFLPSVESWTVSNHL